MGSNDDDDELLDMFMMGMLDKHTSPKSGGGCAGCILLMSSISFIIKKDKLMSFLRKGFEYGK